MSEAVARIQTAAQLNRLGEDIRATRLGVSPALHLRRGLAEQVVALLHGGVNVLLRGAPGVGKTALAESLAMVEWPAHRAELGQLRLVDRPGLNAPSIIATTASRFIGGCFYAHDLENKLQQVLETARAEPAILFIDNLHECVGIGSSSSDPETDVANLLIPHLDRGLRVLGATTPEGEARLRSRNPRLLQRFTLVDVPAPDADESREIAGLRLAALERRGASVSSGAIDDGFALASRYLPTEPKLSAFLRLAQRAVAAESSVGPRAIRRALAAELGLLPCFVGVGTPPGFDALHARLSGEVFGQPEAVGEVADALTRFSVGLVEANRPIAAFLFAGPSGCGKTSLALATAEALTGSQDTVLRFDMSEYADQWASRRLLEDSDCSLIGQLQCRCAGVLLFDEIEKAHPSVVRLLLQVIGEARLTGATGRAVRFNNFIVMLTTNVGARRWLLGPPVEKTLPLLLSDVAEEFPPEFRARLTRTVVFQPLTNEAGARIVERCLERLNEAPGLVERGLQVMWAEPLASALSSLGICVERGARGVQSVVRGLVSSPLARWLAEHPEAQNGVLMVAPRLERGSIASLAIDLVDDSVISRANAN